MTQKQKWEQKNMRTLSCRVRTEFADRLKAITDAEEISTHQLIINLLTQFMDDYEKGE